jgi:hypothetical protein
MSTAQELAGHAIQLAKLIEAGISPEDAVKMLEVFNPPKTPMKDPHSKASTGSRGGGGDKTSTKNSRNKKTQENNVLELVQKAGPNGVSGFYFKKLYKEAFGKPLVLPKRPNGKPMKLGKYLANISGLMLRDAGKPHMSVCAEEYFDEDSDEEDLSTQKDNVRKLVQEAGRRGISGFEFRELYEKEFKRPLVLPKWPNGKPVKLGKYLAGISGLKLRNAKKPYMSVCTEEDFDEDTESAADADTEPADEDADAEPADTLGLD